MTNKKNTSKKMKKGSLPHEGYSKETDPEILKNQFHSVELPVNGRKLNYQCKLRKNGCESLFVLVKENSVVLKWLTEGNILKMKYYRTGSVSPPESFDTKIKYITKNDSGRFKGHYLMGLDILYDRNSAQNR